MEDRLGKYEIRRPLGKGAAGIVYEAWDPAIARHVAIKTVPLPDASDEEAQEQLERFRREAQAAGRLTHPNIVGVFDYGETAEIAYIVMEYVDGDSLKAVLDRRERFAISEVVRVMDELLAGLGYSHERGVVHRDIKPANLMLTKQGRVKIADFGIARIESSGLTQVGTIMGTPAYMSPEQFTGQVVDARTDLYSAGVVLYQLLTGDRPFEGSMTAIMQKALNTMPSLPSELAVTAPVAFDAIVLRALAKRPEDRFPDARSFAAALHAALIPVTPGYDSDSTMLQAKPSASQPAPAAVTVAPARVEAAAVPRKTNAALVPAIAGAVIILGLAGGAWFLFGGSPPAPAVPAPIAQSFVAPVPPTPPLPTPAPSSLTAATPAPPVVVQPPPAAIAIPAVVAPPVTVDRRALVAAIAALPCAMLSGNLPDEGGWLRLTGVIADGVPRAALDRALADSAPGLRPEGLVQGFPHNPDYCRMLDILAPAGERFGDVGQPVWLRALDGRTRLVTDEVIKLRVRMADFAGEMRIDYLSTDGNVYHVHPADGANPRTYLAGQDVTPGPGNGDGKVGEVGEPYGYDMIVAVASSLPLFSRPRPASEPTMAYLRDLQASVEELHRRGGRVNAAAMILLTGAK